MKVKTVPILAAALATAFTALQGPAVFAQRTNGTFRGAPQPPPQRTFTPVQNSLILPMSNPIAPMGNPIHPIITPPFIRYSDPTPTVVRPDQSRGNRENRGNGRDRDVVLVPVAVPYYYGPNYDYYPTPEPAPVTIPGQLPPVGYDYQRSASFNPTLTPNPNLPSAPTASTVVYVRQPEVYSEPRMIINEPRPNRVVQPPAIGAARADVVARLGQPWGTISARGQETLYFDGLTVVFAADGRVIQVR